MEAFKTMKQEHVSQSGNTDQEHESQREKNKHSGIMIAFWSFVIIAVAIAFIVPGYIRDQSEAAKVIIESIFSLAIVIIVIGQTYINARQARALDIQEEIFRAQSKAAEDATAIAEKSFRVSIRAYIFINEVTLEQPISSGAYPYPKFVLQNSGKTPAYRYRVRFEHGFLEGETDEKARRGIMPPMRPLSNQGHVFGPSEFSTLRPERRTWDSEEQREMAIAGKITYHVWGLICYVDMFNKEHSYPFSLYVMNPDTTLFGYGAYGNDVEIQDEH